MIRAIRCLWVENQVSPWCQLNTRKQILEDFKSAVTCTNWSHFSKQVLSLGNKDRC
jgi:hypothetical protein